MPRSPPRAMTVLSAASRAEPRARMRKMRHSFVEPAGRDDRAVREQWGPVPPAQELGAEPGADPGGLGE